MTWIKNILVLLFGLLLALTVGEVVVRVVAPRPSSTPDDKVRTTDPILGWRILPWAEKIHDAAGFKNKAVLATATIVAIGDSHTYGTAYDLNSSWPAFLGALIKQPVYNLGIGGYGPAQYYYLLDQAIKKKPQTIVVGLLLGNDFFDAYNLVYHYDYWRSWRDPKFVDSLPEQPNDFNHEKKLFQGWRTWIRDKSELYNFLAERTYLWREEVGLAKPHVLGTLDWTNTDPAVTLRFADPKIGTIFWVGGRKLGVDVNNKNIIEGERLTKKFLTAIRAKTNQAGVKLVVVIIPTKELVYAPILGDKIKMNPDFVEVVNNETKLREQMLGFCQTAKLNCVDLYDDLVAKLKQGEVIYPKTWDGHPSQLGYQAYAQIIYDYLH